MPPLQLKRGAPPRPALSRLAQQIRRVQMDQCGRCDDGYYWATDARCYPWGGVCEHGQLTVQAQRAFHNHCATCDDGFYRQVRARGPPVCVRGGCGYGTFQVRPCTQSEPAVCIRCTPCDFGLAEEVAPCTPTADRRCKSCGRSCSSVQIQRAACPKVCEDCARLGPSCVLALAETGQLWGSLVPTAQLRLRSATPTKQCSRSWRCCADTVRSPLLT